MSSSSSTRSSRGSNSSGESFVSNLVQTCQVEPRCTFRVMGGGTDDAGAEFTIPYDSDFTSVYVDYARLAGVTPNSIRLMWANDFVSPESSPFKRGFRPKEVVLTYERDFETPIPVHSNSTGSHSKVVFFVHDMMDSHSHERHLKDKNCTLNKLFVEWGRKRGAFQPNKVQMYLRGSPIYDPVRNLSKEADTLADACVVDGSILYARVVEE